MRATRYTRKAFVCHGLAARVAVTRNNTVPTHVHARECIFPCSGKRISVEKTHIHTCVACTEAGRETLGNIFAPSSSSFPTAPTLSWKYNRYERLFSNGLETYRYVNEIFFFFNLTRNFNINALFDILTRHDSGNIVLYRLIRITREPEPLYSIAAS